MSTAETAGVHSLEFAVSDSPIDDNSKYTRCLSASRRCVAKACAERSASRDLVGRGTGHSGSSLTRNRGLYNTVGALLRALVR